MSPKDLHMCIAVLVQEHKAADNSSVHQQIEYYTAISINDLLLDATGRMNTKYYTE